MSGWRSRYLSDGSPAHEAVVQNVCNPLALMLRNEVTWDAGGGLACFFRRQDTWLGDNLNV